MSQKPLVSIVIPLYNGSNYVENAIQSALAQTYEPIEIIVVNDGSSDAGAGRAICERYAERIAYFEKDNGGCASALNYGIERSHGDFISWLSHDDMYAPEKVEKQLEIYRKYGLDTNNTIVSSVGALMDADGNPMFHPSRQDTGFFSSESAFPYFLNKACPNGCGLLIPRCIFEQYGGFEEQLHYVLDWNLWLKLTLYGVNFYFDREKLVYNRVHAAQVSNQKRELYAIEIKYTIDQLFHLIKENQVAPEFLKQLYYFAFSFCPGDAKKIREYIRANRLRISRFRCIGMYMKRRLRQMAKKIYHRIR